MNATGPLEYQPRTPISRAFSPGGRAELEECLSVGLPRPFLELTPRETVAAFGIDVASVTPQGSQTFDQLADASTKLAEWDLERKVRDPGVLSGPAVDRLKNSNACGVVVTNTLPIDDDRRFDGLEVLSIAPLIARAIREVFEDGSVTSLFDGAA